MRISDWSSDVCSSDLERLVGDLALAVAGFVEVDGVDDAGQVRVGLDDAAHGGGELLAEGLGGFLLRPLERLAAAGHGPAGVGWQVEADQRRVGVDDGQRGVAVAVGFGQALRSEEHTSELQALIRISYAVFCLKKKQHK